MKLFSEQDIEARALRLRVRLFLLTAALIGVVTLAAVAVRHGVFTQTIALSFFAESAHEISKGMAVKVVGFKIGKVEEISIEPDNRIKVEIAVNHNYARLIPRDSVAHVMKEGLIGASIVEILPGEDKKRIVVDNDVLRFERGSGLADLAKKLTDQVIPILHDVKKITASINDPQGDIRQAVHHIGEATVAMRASSEELQKLLHQSNVKVGALGGQVSAILDKTDQNMALVQKSLTTLNGTLPGMLQKIDGALPGMLQKIDGTLENARRISQDSAEQLPGLLRDGKAVAGDTRDIVAGAKKAWPISSLLDPAPTGAMPLDSYVPSR